ncbi:MAG TPA: 6-hydroxymethylpterin diphosphokinase MptE-like protein [Candidatus Nanoarchaeia archaeon]|nr:6-hydroxymethylpterin diphosphokinase MptE-like protein [Candidatus Nanoarchaeia archaeon]
MRFDDWEPIYLEIIRDMGYDRVKDEFSARKLSEMLSSMLPSRIVSLDSLQALIKSKDVLICGNAPTLKAELNDVDLIDYCIIAADGATEVLMNKGVVPDIIVTDLDGAVESEIEASQKGAIMVVHAHGDNIHVINHVLTRLYNIIGSTQVAPLKNVYNFGGFTDGDRCVFLARGFGVSSITLIGFDFDDINVSDIKKKKLDWARKLIEIAMEQKP